MNIFAQYAQPVRSVMDYQADYEAQDMRREQLAGARRQNALADLTAQQTRQTMADQQQSNALIKAAYGGGAAGVVDRLRATGDRGAIDLAGREETQALGRGKTTADIAKTTAETAALQAKARYEAADRLAQKIGMVQTVDDLMAYEAEGIELGIFPAERRGSSLQKARELGGIEQWKAASAQAAVPVLEKFKSDADMARAKLQADTSIKTTGMNNATSLQTTGMTNATTRRGQDMTDQRTRESTQVAREGNDVQRSLVSQKRELEIKEMQDKADERGRSKAGSVAGISSQIGVIDKALKHPGLPISTGLQGAVDPRNYIPGTSAADFRAVADQIGGAAFLQAFESLKGGGAITEMEGKKATDAIARLNRAQSTDEYTKSLNELRGVMTQGYARLAGKQYGDETASAKPAASPAGGPAKITDDAGYNALPSGATFIGPDGKTRRKP